jgi:D-alanyl-D-alanine carboxypeptidase (penicillin-binding protein 5/6)
VPWFWWAVWASAAALLALGYVAFALLRSVPGPTVTLATRPASFPRRPLSLAWPTHGEAAVGVEGIGLIGVNGPDKATPIASIAKVMTAYVVLADHPLRGDAGGPPITVTAMDVAAYGADKTAGQSVVAVRSGERLTERQALQGLLVASGNNIASLLARWDAGSQGAFVARMNAQARALGLSHTRYTDASGAGPGTVSTAEDQVHLAMGAMSVPAFRQTVAMSQATLPIAGRRDNLDGLLGTDGIVGIKTGTTSQAGGCFLFAARERLAGRWITVVGAVLHQVASPAQPSILGAALSATRRLLASTRNLLIVRRVVRRGATLAWMTEPWQMDPVALQAAGSASLAGWPGLPVRTAITMTHGLAAPVDPGQSVATAVVAAGQERATLALVAARTLPAAPLTWRLVHP